jgi:hypothetical protein
MPVEIKELNIKVNVNSTPANTPPGQSSSTTTNMIDASIDKDEIVAICVEQVLEILKDKMER